VGVWGGVVCGVGGEGWVRWVGVTEGIGGGGGGGGATVIIHVPSQPSPNNEWYWCCLVNPWASIPWTDLTLGIL